MYICVLYTYTKDHKCEIHSNKNKLLTDAYSFSCFFNPRSGKIASALTVTLLLKSNIIKLFSSEIQFFCWSKFVVSRHFFCPLRIT